MEFTFEGQKVHWDGVGFSAHWMPRNFAWVCTFASLYPYPRIDWWGANDKPTKVTPVSVVAYGSPYDIEIFDDLKGKPLTAREGYIAIVRGKKKENTVLLGWNVDHPLEFIITEIGPKQESVAGMVKGPITAYSYASTNQKQGYLEGHFLVPVFPVTPRESYFPPDRNQAEAIKTKYGPNHFVTFETIQRAVKAGDPEAELQLANMYQTGHGVPWDVKTARVWYEKAANDGSSGAQMLLATLHQGNPSECYFWAWVAHLNGEPGPSPKTWGNIAGHLTNEQMNQIERRAEDWLRLHPKRRRSAPRLYHG